MDISEDDPLRDDPLRVVREPGLDEDQRVRDMNFDQDIDVWFDAAKPPQSVTDDLIKGKLVTFNDYSRILTQKQKRDYKDFQKEYELPVDLAEAFRSLSPCLNDQEYLAFQRQNDLCNKKNWFSRKLNKTCRLVQKIKKKNMRNSCTYN
jgi:hypothetical protein